MANLQAGLQGAQTGAGIGMQFGGPWGGVIGGVLGGVIGLTTKDEELEAMKQHNKLVVKYTQQSLFDLQRSQVVNNMRTAQALASYQAQAREGKSTYNAQYGAADVIGASSQALSQVIDYQKNAAMANEWMNFHIGIDSYNTQVSQITNQGYNSLQSYKGQSKGLDIAGLVNTGLNAYQQYQQTKLAPNYMNPNTQSYSGLNLGGLGGGGAGSTGNGGWSSFSNFGG